MAEIVFIHGTGDSAAVWAGQVERFAADHEVLAVDLPGHGVRLGDRPLETLDDDADEVARQVRERGFARPVVVGHSMGGGVALLVALRHPTLARALVLAASGARLRIHPDFIEAARRDAEAAPDTPQVQAADKPIELGDAVSPRAAADVLAWLAERVGQATARATYADMLATDRFDVMERLAEIAPPTLVIAGEDDRLTPPKYQRFLADRLANARLVLLPDAGHYVQVERSADFNRELERFLAELPE
jgi:pimeloyl-ACP methyl ester carboxylesterase